MVKYIYLHKAQEKTHIVLFRYEKYECVHVCVCVCVCVCACVGVCVCVCRTYNIWALQ